MAEHIEETDIASFTRSCRHLGIGLRQLGVSSQDVAWEIIQNCLQRRLHFCGKQSFESKAFHCSDTHLIVFPFHVTFFLATVRSL